jgi:ATP-dependent exoDNAse (exonuclease V) beta subunit
VLYRLWSEDNDWRGTTTTEPNCLGEQAASVVVQAALAHPLLERARQARICGRCRREAPVTLTLEDGTIVEGVVDIAFLENNCRTVMDFKTDRELRGELQHYERQVGLYATAISRATGKPTLAILISV